jgi:hypothetical protein
LLVAVAGTIAASVPHKVYAVFTAVRDGGLKGMMMAIRHQMSAIDPAAGKAARGAALSLILGGLLLLSAP